MAIPIHLWLNDDAGKFIKGESRVNDREGSTEVVCFAHGLHTPTDGNTGRLTGTRIHDPLCFEKEIDCISPFLMKAVATGQMLASAEFKLYNINDAGWEAEYYNILLEKVRVVSVCPMMHSIKDPSQHSLNHLESIELRYEKITWKFCDGNIIFTDTWNDR